MQMQPTAKTGVSSSGSEHVLRGGQGAATRWPIRGPCGRVSTVPLWEPIPTELQREGREEPKRLCV